MMDSNKTWARNQRLLKMFKQILKKFQKKKENAGNEINIEVKNHRARELVTRKYS